MASERLGNAARGVPSTTVPPAVLHLTKLPSRPKICSGRQKIVEVPASSVDFPSGGTILFHCRFAGIGDVGDFCPE
jgi:hypothetical protein